MTSLQAVSAGIRAVNRAKRLWVTYWLWNVAFALLVVLPLAVLLFRNLGHSLYAERLAANFEVQYLLEVLRGTHGWPLIALAPVAVLAAGGFLLAGVYLAGGALWIYRDAEPRYAAGVFYQGCGRHFGRLFWLLVLSLAAYGLVLALNGALEALANKLWGEGIEARPFESFGWFRIPLVALLLLAVNMTFDYARIRMVADDERNPFKAALAAWRMVVRNPGRTAGTYALVGLLMALAVFVYGAVANLLPRGAAGGLVAVFLWQQAYMFIRVWVRLLFYASQMRMYDSLSMPVTIAFTAAAPEADSEAAGDPTVY